LFIFSKGSQLFKKKKNGAERNRRNEAKSPKGFKETSQNLVKLITMYTWAGRHVACGFLCKKAEEERKGSE
jgi:hypothetical protein